MGKVRTTISIKPETREGYRKIEGSLSRFLDSIFEVTTREIDKTNIKGIYSVYKDQLSDFETKLVELKLDDVVRPIRIAERLFNTNDGNQTGARIFYYSFKHGCVFSSDQAEGDLSRRINLEDISIAELRPLEDVIQDFLENFKEAVEKIERISDSIEEQRKVGIAAVKAIKSDNQES